MKEKRATKNVLSLSPNEAFDFLMKSEHFHEFAVGKNNSSGAVPNQNLYEEIEICPEDVVDLIGEDVKSLQEDAQALADCTLPDSEIEDLKATIDSLGGIDNLHDLI